MDDLGASAGPTGLGGAEALEPHSRLHPSNAIPRAAHRCACGYAADGQDDLIAHFACAHGALR